MERSRGGGWDAFPGWLNPKHLSSLAWPHECATIYGQPQDSAPHFLVCFLKVSPQVEEGCTLQLKKMGLQHPLPLTLA